MFLKNEKNLQLNLYHLKSACFYKISAGGGGGHCPKHAAQFVNQSFCPSPVGMLFSECFCHLVDNRNTCILWLMFSTLSTCTTAIFSFISSLLFALTHVKQKRKIFCQSLEVSLKSGTLFLSQNSNNISR